ncbi:MAG: competence/damage-inducible protein A [Candidatus Epulonipiscioides saccharophilum]|nr:MAG: competence/damage-inducible protein A [Epulopiscium sp. AS2M-Bin001]
MKIELIAVGNEVVYGHTVNTNASYMASEFEKYGLEVCYQGAIRDREEDINQALEIAKKRVDMIILCGGLGPTKDDLTKEAVAKYFGLELELNKEAYEEIERFFIKLQKPMLDTNYKQALLPVGSKLIPNYNGTAPGCYFEINSVGVALFPGPPRELRPMFEYFINEFIIEKLDTICLTEEVRLLGIGESFIAEEIDDLLGCFEAKQVEVAPYLGEGFVSIRLKGYGQSKEDILHNINFYKIQIQNRLKSFIIGDTKKVAEELVYDLLIKHSLSITTAESCTGGLLASRIVNVSGASEIFQEAFVTYSNASKIKTLGVKKETLEKYGAVSEQTAQEMAIGAQKKSGSDVAISITGIAGPTGASETKPIGLIYIGIALKENIYSYKINLYGTRYEIRSLSTAYALQYLARLLQNL